MSSARSRRIDHLVLAVRDLDAAAACYQRLGFRVGARNRHPWGTENRLVQFRTSFLELITVADAAGIPPHTAGFFSFGAFVKDYLARREGLAMVVLDSANASRDAERFARLGIGDFRPFHFERTGRAPDGSPTTVGFSLAFARDDGLPEAGFFVCRQHHPDAFWNPLFQNHPNGAMEVSGVVLDVENPQEHVGFVAAFAGMDPSEGGRRFAFDNGGRLELRTASAGHGFAAFSVGVRDLDPVRAADRTGGAVP